MTGTPTPNFGLPQYDETDQAALDVLLNGITSQLDTSLKVAIDNGNNYRIGTDAGRLAIASPTEGLKFRTTDTKLDWIYTGGAWVGDTGWTPITLSNGWVNYGDPYTPPQCRRINGVVHVSALIKGGTATLGTTLATLPVGFRPAAQLLMPAAAGTPAVATWVDVNADGRITAGSSVGSYIPLQFSFPLG